MKKLTLSREQKSAMGIWIAFCSLLFVCLCVFFIKIHPIMLFDADDWTYLAFTRTSKLLPSRNEWNPTRILPENLMPLAGYLGKPFLMQAGENSYDAVTANMGLMLAVFVLAYVVLATRALGERLRLGILQSIRYLDFDMSLACLSGSVAPDFDHLLEYAKYCN